MVCVYIKRAAIEAHSSLLPPSIENRKEGELRPPSSSYGLILVDFEHRHERFLRYLYATNLLHPFLTFLLLLKQLPLPANVTTVAFGKNVFAHRFNCLAS